MEVDYSQPMPAHKIIGLYPNLFRMLAQKLARQVEKNLLIWTKKLWAVGQILIR